MSRGKEPDHFDWFGALDRSAKEAAGLREPAPLRLVVQCRCGATESQGREIREVVDLRSESGDVIAERNEGQRPCRACPHYIHHGAMCVIRYFSDTSTVRDYYHPECVRL